MNGAELACGTALKVEPSDPLYALRKKQQQASRYGPGAATEGFPDEGEELAKEKEKKSSKSEESGPPKIEQNEAGGAAGDEDDEDLEDFFASL